MIGWIRRLPRADGTGVAVAYELLRVTLAVANLIRDNRAFQIHSVLQTGKSQGMFLLDDMLENLFEDNTPRHEGRADRGSIWGGN